MARRIRDTLQERLPSGDEDGPWSEQLRARRKKLRANWSMFIRRGRPWELVTAPVIYSLIIPFLIMDVFITIYQWLCFPIYRLPIVKRRQYISVDRGKLTYLNFMQKFNCLYCGYCNGVVAYAREVAGRTEFYWCPVKHNREIPDPHGYYDKFLAYGDGEDWDEKFIAMKTKARACEDCDACH